MITFEKKLMKMKRLLSIIILFSIVLSTQAQVYKYAVHFTDKDHTPYSLDQPEEYLSQRSIERRAKFQIPITEEDLPVNPAYIAEVLQATSDAELIIQVKWLNAIIISLSDMENIEIIQRLPMVSEVELVFRSDLKVNRPDKLTLLLEDQMVSNPIKSITEYDSAFYGGAWTQIHQLKGEKLHQLGHLGHGMLIAVLDAGFTGVDERLVFDKLWENDQIIGHENMVDPGETVFEGHTHGTSVLSTMGGYWEGNLIGTAPEADYWLIKTEDGTSEFLIEEYNWVAGAAFADSVGADVLNTSLGYTVFDDTTMNHTYDELNGDSTIITRGSNMAFKKGMLVVTSAGNSGNGSWKYIGAPADGNHVFTIGAVDLNENIASFSSLGFPWSDEIKPNIVARGHQAYLANPYNDVISTGNGTSFSSPILAGMAASLWSAEPSLSPAMIKRAITYSADKYSNPDQIYGHGLPDFERALSILSIEDLQATESLVSVSPNPVKDFLAISFNNDHQGDFILAIFNIQGSLIEQQSLNTTGSRMINIGDYPAGIYILEVRQENLVSRVKISKQ